ncbi:DctP family TRAP transporter solute-binding subunit [Acidaminobacter hydrogenoformans]|uniref:Tripartite ATP-independent transporter solute receptor, DctP family n=1 Tax=Acidaminobacter hydrogenoformans DSM 2784 TaxID=1120920 RepID=A0A1G5RVL1_9FIRM|nr:DctP family TRAP transporter solute-binding subunit [Acidaminobacter hydrogenoformans]SCZ78152.1 tripartite ATP-independent transporter solute receptor, DctP family [Acidaminobacter hydrogenoformans DSM 2784]
MKKLSVFLLIFVMILGMATGCSSPEPAAPSEAPAETPAETPAESVVIKVAHIVSEETATHRGAVAFKDYVEKESGGTIEVQLFPNGQLGGDLQLTEAVALNTVQIAIPSTAVLTAYDPIFGLLDLPFIFKDVRAGFNALDGDLGKKLDEKLAPVGLMNLGYSYNGARSMSNNVRPINEPKDLEGIKMRVMESPVFIDMFKYLGANPTPMSFGEVFTGLQQGTVDGQENAPALVYASKFYEVQEFYSLTSHVQSYLANVMNADFFNGLSEDQQKVVMEGARKFLVEAEREDEINDNIETVDKLKEAGMTVNEISAENMQKFMDALVPMHDKYKAEFGQEWFDLIEQYNN